MSILPRNIVTKWIIFTAKICLFTAVFDGFLQINKGEDVCPPLNLLVLLIFAKYQNILNMPRGAQFKHQSLPLMRELNECGYNTANLHILIKCTKADSLKFFRDADRMKLGQIKAISLAINKPISYCVNQLLKLPKQSPNWMSDDYDPMQRIAALKSQ